MQGNSKRAAAITAGVVCAAFAAYSVLPDGGTRSSIEHGSTPSARANQEQKSGGTFKFGSERNPAPARRRPHSSVTNSPAIPSGNATDVVASLRPLAQAGDRDAALNIYLKINDCRTAISQAVRRAPTTDPSALVPPECGDLTTESYKEAATWLELVADSGNQYAQLLYANSATGVVGPPSEWIKHPERVQAYKRKAMQYLHENAARGSVEAWQSLSSVYASGTLSPQDNLKAYAYYRAAQIADPRFAGPARIEHLKSLLSSTELTQAETASRSVYEGTN